MAFRRYTLLILTGFVLTVLGVAILNWLNDPYGIFGAPRLSWFNEAKPFGVDRGRIAKLYQVRRHQPRGLIVGNSRPEMGLDPKHLCWPEMARPVYNTALPGLGVYHQVRYAQHAMASGPVKFMVIGVDFLDFLKPADARGNPYQWPPAAENSDEFLVLPDGGAASSFRLAQAKNYAAATLSLDALGHSLATIARQGNDFVATRMTNGFNPAENFYEPIVRTEGVGILFAQKNRGIAKKMNGREWSLDQGAIKWSVEFEALRQVLRQARADGVNVVMYINPYHAEYLAMIELSGLWNLFEDWKKRLFETAKLEATPLWDFTNFDRFSTEDVGGITKKGESLSWFWEPSHYRKELGDLILANIWRDHCPQAYPVEKYGTRIDAANFAYHLARIRVRKEQYMTVHKSVVARLTGLIPSQKGN